MTLDMKEGIPKDELPCIWKVSRIEDGQPERKREEEKEELREGKWGGDIVRALHKESRQVVKNDWVSFKPKGVQYLVLHH